MLIRSDEIILFLVLMIFLVLGPYIYYKIIKRYID